MLQNKIKISVVIPVYNAEAYLNRCLDSLFLQDLPSEEYEIIAVDDGSSDNSARILESMAEIHSNLRWITIENRGVGEARNYGCDIAKGQYLLFVDADDYVQPNSLLRIYTVLEKERLDVLVLDYRYVDDKGELPPYIKYAPREEKYKNQVMEGKNFIMFCLPQVVWCSAYRMDFWKKFNFKFLSIRHEDVEIIPRIFYSAERILYLPLTYYYYYKNPNSFMMTYNVDSCYDLIRAMKSVDDFRKQYVKESEVSTFLKDRIAGELLNGLFTGIKSELPNSVLKQVLKEIKNVGLTLLPRKKQGIHAFLYKYYPLVFLYYYKLKKRDK